MEGWRRQKSPTSVASLTTFVLLGITVQGKEPAIDTLDYSFGAGYSRHVEGRYEMTGNRWGLGIQLDDALFMTRGGEQEETVDDDHDPRADEDTDDFEEEKETSSPNIELDQTTDTNAHPPGGMGQGNMYFPPGHPPPQHYGGMNPQFPPGMPYPPNPQDPYHRPFLPPPHPGHDNVQNPPGRYPEGQGMNRYPPPPSRPGGDQGPPMMGQPPPQQQMPYQYPPNHRGPPPYDHEGHGTMKRHEERPMMRGRGPNHPQQRPPPQRMQPPPLSRGPHDALRGRPPHLTQEQKPKQDPNSSGYNPDAISIMKEVGRSPSIQASKNDKSSDSSKSSEGFLGHRFDKELIFDGLKRLYRKRIRPLEISSKYAHFHSPPLGPSDFDAKPMVLLLGQYSVGKTSFIKYLLGDRDFPGIRIGPEPTTDRFTAIMLGNRGDKIVPGAALCSQTDRPFRGLSVFGNNFLSRFEGIELEDTADDAAFILHNVTLVDSPGILSGQKQQIGRHYDYEQVMKWFAERADLIIIMFDAHKLDISDELKRVIELLIPHQDKIRVVLNKADMITTQQLMRVYGALMWSLGKVMMTPEVSRVYVGSFWGDPLVNEEQATLFGREKFELFADIMRLPQNAVMRRINELVKRARSVKVHAYIIHYLRKQLVYKWNKKEKQKKLIGKLQQEFTMCARRYELPLGDFPSLPEFRQALTEIKDLSEFQKLDKKMVKEMDKVFSVEIPELLERARNE
mmetsp:Transcript_2007/g.2808  ORF Transcript_2007/g.2808 Transcript_2007/m.2808 type:complete len:734 (+) Transcript_2007:100-2301(+)